MADLEPTGQKVYDPFLGKERDAFPGEILPPEQEKTMQRLMREGEEEFQRIFDAVRERLSEDEADAVLKAGKLYAEKKRKEYLEAIRSNPANIVGNILKDLNPAGISSIRSALFTLNAFVEDTKNFVNTAKASDKAAGRPLKDTLSYTSKIAPKRITAYEPRLDEPKLDIEKMALTILKQLDSLPSPEIASLDQLITSIASAKNGPESGKPFYYVSSRSGITQIRNLPAIRPGLEGVFASVTFVNKVVDRLEINGTAEALTRVYNTGQFTPYNPQTS